MKPGETLEDYITRNKTLLQNFQSEVGTASGLKKKLLQKRISDLGTEVKSSETAQANRVQKKKDFDESQVLQLFPDYKGFYDYYYNTLTPDQRTSLEGQWTAEAKKEVDPFYEEQKRRIDEANKTASGTADISRSQTELAQTGAEQNKDQFVEGINTQGERLNQDFERYTNYAKDDFARNLAQINKGFAKSLSQASVAFGVRNVAGSGIQASFNHDAREDRNDQTKDQEIGMNRTIEGLAINRSRGEEDLDTSKDNYLQNYDITKQGYDLSLKSSDLTDTNRQNTYKNALFDNTQAQNYSTTAAAQFNKEDYMKELQRKELQRLNLKAAPTTYN